MDARDRYCEDWIELAQDECLTSRLVFASRTVYLLQSTGTIFLTLIL
jgi:hypothetical protein